MAVSPRGWTAITLFQHIVVAIHQFALVIAQVHTSTSTELPYATLGALARTCPLPVAELLEAVLPYIPKTIAVDVALCVVGSDACTARDVAIHTNRGYRDTSVAHIEVVAHLRLVASEKTLAGVVQRDAALVACLAYELHKCAELLGIEV